MNQFDIPPRSTIAAQIATLPSAEASCCGGEKKRTQRHTSAMPVLHPIQTGQNLSSCRTGTSARDARHRRNHSFELLTSPSYTGDKRHLQHRILVETLSQKRWFDAQRPCALEAPCFERDYTISKGRALQVDKLLGLMNAGP